MAIDPFMQQVYEILNGSKKLPQSGKGPDLMQKLMKGSLFQQVSPKMYQKVYDAVIKDMLR